MVPVRSDPAPAKAPWRPRVSDAPEGATRSSQIRSGAPTSSSLLAARAKSGDIITIQEDSDPLPAVEVTSRATARRASGGDRKTRSDGDGDSIEGEAGVVDSDDDADHESESESERLEGTAAYLAPELVRGGSASPASDAWALGCVIYFCLAGRPPVWAETQTQILAQIVSFDHHERTFPKDFPVEAQALVKQLLDPNPATRLGGGPEGLDVLKNHPFFSGLDVPRLYLSRAPKLEAGTVAPQADAAWTKRQNSIMWTPKPIKYTFTSDKYVLEEVPESAIEAGSAFVGARAGAGPTCARGPQLVPPSRARTTGLE